MFFLHNPVLLILKTLDKIKLIKKASAHKERLYHYRYVFVCVGFIFIGAEYKADFPDCQVYLEQSLLSFLTA